MSESDLTKLESGLVALGDEPEARVELLEPGAVVGNYRVLSKLGEGGCAIVYAAEHVLLRRPAAVKVLRSELTHSREMVARFLREAQVVNLIRHPNIVDIFEFGYLLDGSPFFVMEHLRGQSLREHILGKGRLSLEEALALFAPICSALGAAHRQQIVHRDVKPGNVFVVEGQPPMVKLLDFGLAKLLHPEPGQEALTKEHHRMGTSTYMAPEQIRGEPVDARTDIYALGVLLYLMLTGRAPYVALEAIAVEALHLKAAVPRVSATAPVPPEIDAAVTRCLQKAKEDRFPSVEALLEALQQGAREVAESVTVPGIAVEVRIALGGVDEERLMRAGDLLAAVEPLLSGAGLQPIVQTGTVLLYAMALEPAQAPRTREALQRVAQRIAALGAPEASAGLEVRVRTEEGEVSMQGGELVGGALLNAERWERST